MDTLVITTRLLENKDGNHLSIIHTNILLLKIDWMSELSLMVSCGRVILVNLNQNISDTKVLKIPLLHPAINICETQHLSVKTSVLYMLNALSPFLM